MYQQDPGPSTLNQPRDEYSIPNGCSKVKSKREKIKSICKDFDYKKAIMPQQVNNFTSTARAPCKVNKKKKLVRKRLKPKKKKCQKKRSYICDPCRCDINPCDFSSCYDPCDSEYETPRLTEVSARRSSKPVSPLRKQEPKDMGLFLNMLGEEKTEENGGRSDDKMMISAKDFGCTEGNVSKPFVEDARIQNKLLEILCSLESKKQLCCQECPGECFPSSCNRDFCNPCSPFANILTTFQQSLASSVNPCRCKLSCAGRNKSLSRCCSCVPCCKSRCCIDCCPQKPSTSRRSSKATVNDKELKYKSRMWLLDRNEKLERKLLKLKRKQKNFCCECYPTDFQARFPLLFWRQITESMMKSLVESHPAVRKQASICPCRIQDLSKMS